MRWTQPSKRAKLPRKRQSSGKHPACRLTELMKVSRHFEALHRRTCLRLPSWRCRRFEEVYTRSARTTRRFSNVGIGVHVCRLTMSLPLTCPMTHESVGSTTSFSVTL
jgi:hypothetical protein